ncbi:hypothetical protein CA13_73180 [Planctomycetes bacterium CA13]|uniref:Uncharacterized protein n=1 Tax=Novipirellula herctigrandis TaxID=2527986 RepID=A0A5C5YLF2_9BACT|nr:hypothetical protein CA13_73180 [Planctomycetes bacterium CA13]
MPRIKRADEAGCIYHALNRGNAKNGKVRKLTPFPFYFPKIAWQAVITDPLSGVIDQDKNGIADDRQ